MQIARRFTVSGQDPFAKIPYTSRSSRIVNPDGTVVFEMKNVMAPEAWSQVATDILAQKYFRRAGVPLEIAKVGEAGVPSWLQRGKAAAHSALGAETDSRQVFRRLAGCWTYWGWKGGYFSSEADAQTFFDAVVIGRRTGSPHRAVAKRLYREHDVLRRGTRGNNLFHVRDVGVRSYAGDDDDDYRRTQRFALFTIEHLTRRVGARTLSASASSVPKRARPSPEMTMKCHGRRRP